VDEKQRRWKPGKKTHPGRNSGVKKVTSTVYGQRKKRKSQDGEKKPQKVGVDTDASTQRKKKNLKKKNSGEKNMTVARFLTKKKAVWGGGRPEGRTKRIAANRKNKPSTG